MMTMPREYYRTGNYKVDHTTFGGDITLFDFEGHHTLSSIADKIASDLRFDEQCRKNISNKEKNKNYKKGRQYA